MRKTDIETARAMMELRMKGESYQKIADTYGTSRQNAYSIIKNYAKVLSGARGHGFHIERIPYRGMYEYFAENEYESVHAFACKVLDGKENTHFSTKMKSFLMGEHNSLFTIKQVEKMCEVVGRPFEEVFEERRK